MKYLNVSIDDVSPHPESSIKVLDRCFEIIKVFPDIKFTLFIPAAYWRTKSHRTKRPLYLNEHKDFCDKIKSLNKENFEIGFHGYLHGVPNISNNDEVAAIGYKEAEEVFRNMLKTITRAGLSDTFKPIFRPPAWRMSKQAIRAALDMGMEILALSKEDYARKTYQNMDKEKYTIHETCNPPFKPLALTPKTEIVYHACEWDKNYLSKEKTEKLVSFLKNNKQGVKYAFIEEMLNGQI